MDFFLISYTFFGYNDIVIREKNFKGSGFQKGDDKILLRKMASFHI